MEVAVISLSGIVQWKSTPIAGDEMNKAIMVYAKDVFNILLGETNAELIKMQLGSALPLAEPIQINVRGRDILTGLPKEIMMNDTHVREAIDRILREITKTIKEVIETTPPELVADIHERGMVLTGGDSLLRGIDTLIKRETDIAVRVSDDPLTAVVRGMGILFEQVEPLNTIKIPSSR